MDVHRPTKGTGNDNALIDMTKAATGVTTKSGQANRIVRDQSNNTLEAQLGQCMWILSLHETHATTDPEGTQACETKPCQWDADVTQFKRSHDALSIAKHLWTCCGVTVVVCDGTFTRSRGFKHAVLVAVTFDSNNNEIVILCDCCCSC